VLPPRSADCRRCVGGRETGSAVTLRVQALERSRCPGAFLIEGAFRLYQERGGRQRSTRDGCRSALQHALVRHPSRVGFGWPDEPMDRLQATSPFFSATHRENKITRVFSINSEEHFFCPFVFNKPSGAIFIFNIFLCQPVRTLISELVSRRNWRRLGSLKGSGRGIVVSQRSRVRNLRNAYCVPHVVYRFPSTILCRLSSFTFCLLSTVCCFLPTALRPPVSNGLLN